ncbi:hypothetical protein R50072_10180 [Simiduia litorea]|uniref:hypothetical protein n=1 Tax=Simiduia litorea TaxID=1435348 RepID=UPI0036F3C348
MHNHVCFTYLQLRNPSQDVLFSGSEDYRATLDVIADLSQNHTRIGAFCLLEQEVHLIALADAAQSLALSQALLDALTGNPNHPLSRHWTFKETSRKQLPQLLAQMHRLPCTRGLCSNADIYPWTSHQAFAQPSLAPTWLSTEALWRLITPRHSNRVRAYLHLLEQRTWPSAPQTPRQHQSTSLTTEASELTERRVAEFVLRDHQTQWPHLSHHRSQRRKQYLAGLSCALCQYLAIFDENNTILNELFDCSVEELIGLARLASREASQYIITSASKLSAPAVASLHLPNTSDKSRVQTTYPISDATKAGTDEWPEAVDDESEFITSADDIDLPLDFPNEEDVALDLPTIRLVARQ